MYTLQITLEVSIVAQWFGLLAHSKKDQRPFYVEFLCSLSEWVSFGCSGFLQQAKDMQDLADFSCLLVLMGDLSHNVCWYWLYSLL